MITDAMRLHDTKRLFQQNVWDMRLKMRPGLKRRWVKALRSGRYQKGTQFLCADGKYSVLGVLCNELVDDDWVWDPHREMWSLGTPTREEEARFDFPPKKDYVKWFKPDQWGHPRHHGCVSLILGQIWKLGEFGMPFSEIGDLIEELL